MTEGVDPTHIYFGALPIRAQTPTVLNCNCQLTTKARAVSPLEFCHPSATTHSAHQLTLVNKACCRPKNDPWCSPDQSGFTEVGHRTALVPSQACISFSLVAYGAVAVFERDPARVVMATKSGVLSVHWLLEICHLLAVEPIQ